MAPKSVRICPECGSTNIGVGGLGGPTVFCDSGGVSGPAWDFCKDCGHGKTVTGKFPPILEIDADKIKAFREEMKKKATLKR